MGHDNEPSADYIVKFAETQKQAYSPQSMLDTEAKEMYQGTNPIEAKKPDKDDTGIRRVKAGQAGQTVDERVSVLLGDLFLRVTPRGAGPAEEHASDKLEPFLNGALRVMQDEDPFWDDGVQDMVVQGRICLRGPMPAPQLWGDEEIQKLTEEMGEAETEEEFKSADKAVQKYKRNNLAIICERVPVDSVYPAFRRKGELAEIVEIREMRKDDIENEWGEIVGENDPDKVRVYEYANQKFVATVVATEEPKLVRKWEHGMRVAGRRVVPYVFEAGHKLMEGDGRLWRGILFHVKSLLESQDETLTDIRTVIREYVTSPYVATLDVALRESSDNLQKAEEFKVGGGADTTLHLLMNPETGHAEKLERGPIPQVNMDAYRYLEWTKGLLDQQVLRPPLHGGGPAGESAVGMAHANAYAKSELRRYHKALERAGGKLGRLLFASVVALSEHFPDIPDEVTVRHRDAKNKSKEVQVTPKDVEDHFSMIDARVDLNVPFNEAAAVQNASVAIQSGALDHYTAREMLLHIQNPQEIDERQASYRMRQAATQIVIAQALQELTGSVQAGDIPVGELIKRAMSLPEAAEAAIMEVLGGGDGAGGVPRGASTAMNNQARAQRPQQMSQLAGTEMEIP